MDITLRKDLVLVLVLFIVAWFAMNNSYLVNRDEMWYTDYAIALDDTETGDVRHITEVDQGQAGSMIVFRLMQRVSIATFGQTLFGLRALNLVFGLLTLTVLTWAFHKLAVLRWYLFAFTGILLFDPFLAGYAHHIRPEWIIVCCAIMAVAFLVVFIVESQKKYLILAGMIGAFSSGIYWNGLAVVAAMEAVLVFLTIKRKINLTTFLAISLVSGLVVSIVFLLPLLYYWPEAQALFTNDASQTARLSSGSALVEYPISLLNMLAVAFVLSGKSAMMLGGMLLLGLATFFLLLRSQAINVQQKLVAQSLLLFFVVALLTVALRDRERAYWYVRHFTGVMYMWLLVGLSFLWRADHRVFRWPTAKVASIGVGLFIALIVTLTTKGAWSNCGQWQAYMQYKEDLTSVIPQGEGRVLTTYDFSWAMEDYPKFFLEAIAFQKPQSYVEIKEIFERYDVQYVIVDERSRLRLQGQDENQERYFTWYFYWDRLLREEYEQIGTVYNKYYRPNKGLPPQDPRGFVTEIWRKETEPVGDNVKSGLYFSRITDQVNSSLLLRAMWPTRL